MKVGHLYLASLFLLAGFGLNPLRASGAPQEGTRRDSNAPEERRQSAGRSADDKQPIRVYDRKHKDYHDWNDNEDRSYRQYLSDNHRPYRDYAKLKRGQQTEYWNWRHTHEAEEHGTMR